MKPRRVLVITGGSGPEHVASIESALGILENLFNFGVCVITQNGIWLDEALSQDYLREYDAGGIELASQLLLLVQIRSVAPEDAIAKADVVFPAIHGPFGEDGVLIGLCQAFHKPFVGCGILTSNICLDKATCNAVLTQAGIPKTPFAVVLPDENTFDGVDLPLPWVVKPSDGGCSLGVSLIHFASELPTALAKSREHYPKSAVVVEVAVQNMIKLDVSVLEEADGTLSVTPCGVRKSRYPETAAADIISIPSPQETHRHGNMPEWAVPAPGIPEKDVLRMQELAKKTFRVVRASCWLRVDFFYIPSTRKILVNEINSMPALARGAMIFRLWEAAGVTGSDLIRRIVNHGLDRGHSLG